MCSSSATRSRWASCWAACRGCGRRPASSTFTTTARPPCPRATRSTATARVRRASTPRTCSPPRRPCDPDGPHPQHDGRGQIWFASAYHAAAFLVHADETFADHASRFTHDPRPEMERAARVVPPPVSDAGDDGKLHGKPARKRIIAAAEASDGAALTAALQRFADTGHDVDLFTLGRVEGPGRRAAGGGRPWRHGGGVAGDPRGGRLPGGGGGIRGSTRGPCGHCGRGLNLVVPGARREAFYEELLPESAWSQSLHDDTPADVVSKLADAPRRDPPDGLAATLVFAPDTAVAAIDARLDRLVTSA